MSHDQSKKFLRGSRRELTNRPYVPDLSADSPLSVPVKGRRSQQEGGKSTHLRRCWGAEVVARSVCDVASVAVFGEAPMVDFVTRGETVGNSSKSSPAPPISPHQPHPSPSFCDTTPPHPVRITLWDASFPSPLSRTRPPPCLRFGRFYLVRFFFSFSFLPSC